ncbi:hypothetical protein [Sulfurimonas autotrophica]|uniref:Uncharacterized protein n=1 Tax=Sulfurimonas autotrophica (strain ATCC BAA-671 / DSM 16294 / JCM 11897 / OK10) TaxID=563040 RepID=E0URK8_SULAO|nr:hypothetical protein [Sulfurimonas autotrophica]ADN08952.1 conserved hypothetical protein [Sulfurimonas autotrophica DSM 16294]
MTVLLLFNAALFANDLQDVKEISLKKDEQKKILVKYDNKTRLFKFRWTLYINDGLVILRSYDKTVAQNILYLNHKNQSFRVELKTRGADFYNVPYILVKFKEFDAKKNIARFELYLSDDKDQISLEILKNKQKTR